MSKREKIHISTRLFHAGLYTRRRVAHGHHRIHATPHAELRDGQAAERQHDAHAAAALQKDAVTGVHHLLLPPALADLEDDEGALHRDHDGAAQEDRAR